MGRIIAGCTWWSVDDMIPAAVDRHSLAFQWLTLVNRLRVKSRTGVCIDLQHALANAQDAFTCAVGGQHQSRHYAVHYFFRGKFYLCLSLRNLTIPRAPFIENRGSRLPLSQADRRVLAPTSLVPYATYTVAQQATNSLLDVWAEIKGKTICVWVDDFHKQRYGVDPGNTDKSPTGTLSS